MAKDTKFKKGQSGNPNGRPRTSSVNPRITGVNKLKKLLKTLDPLVDESILLAAEIMGMEEGASPATKLKAAALLLEKYLQINSDIYFQQLPTAKAEDGKTGEEDEDDNEEKPESSESNLVLFSDRSKN